MAEQIHYINGQRVKNPANANDLSIELNFQNDRVEQAVTVGSFDWYGETHATLKSIYDSGVTGGNGVLVGVPHEIKIAEKGQISTIFKGYIDLRTAEWDENRVTADSVDQEGIELFEDRADGVSYRYLYEKGDLSPSEFVPVPYVLSSIPNYRDTFLVTFAITYVTQELQKQITDIASSVGQSSTVIDSAGGVINLIAQIIYTTSLLIAIVKLILDMVDLIIQRVKFKMAMSVNRLIEIGANELGLTYKSSILQDAIWSKLHLIPRQLANPVTQQDDRIFGFLTPDPNVQTGFYDGTFGDLLRGIKAMFNAKLIVNNGQLSIEPNLPPTSARFKLQPVYTPKFTDNSIDLVANINITFAYDNNDLNTIDNWLGTNVSVQAVYKNSVGSDSLLSGSNRVAIPFSRIFDKRSLSVPEKVADTLLGTLGVVLGIIIKAANVAIKGINEIVRLINKVKKALSAFIDIKVEINPVDELEDPNLGNILENRIGMAMLEKDIVSVDRVCLLDVNENDPLKTKISLLNQPKIRARNLYEEFYKSSSFVPDGNPNHAQRRLITYEGVQMNYSDVVNVREDRAVRLPDGTIAEVLSCGYNPAKQLANFVVSVKRIWSNNLKEEISEPTGT